MSRVKASASSGAGQIFTSVASFLFGECFLGIWDIKNEQIHRVDLTVDIKFYKISINIFFYYVGDS